MYYLQFPSLINCLDLKKKPTKALQSPIRHQLYRVHVFLTSTSNRGPWKSTFVYLGLDLSVMLMGIVQCALFSAAFRSTPIGTPLPMSTIWTISEGGKFGNLWNKTKTEPIHSEDFGATHKGWKQQNKQSPGQSLLQHCIPSLQRMGGGGEYYYHYKRPITSLPLNTPQLGHSIRQKKVDMHSANSESLTLQAAFQADGEGG